MNAFLNEMRALAVSLYPFNGIPSGYEAQKLEIYNLEVTQTNSNFYKYYDGFAAALFINANNPNTIIIVFAGTDPTSPNDLEADLQLMMGNKPEQMKSAEHFYNSVLNSDFKDKNKILVGHSLGGALAQLIGAKTGNIVYSFNAIGVKKCLPQIGCNSNGSYPNIHNYCVMNDWFGMMGGHLGELKLLPLEKIDSPDILNCISATHNTPFFSTINFAKAISKPYGYNEPEALSVWYYDMCNKIDKVSSSYTSLINFIRRSASPQALERAIEIFRSTPGILAHKLYFKVSDTEYIVLNEDGTTLNGTSANEILYGNNKKNTIYGTGGKDIIYGGEDNSKLYGGSGNDTIFAEDGDDILDGGSGHDELHPCLGNDKMFGGYGYDLYFAGRLMGKKVINDKDGSGCIIYDGIKVQDGHRIEGYLYTYNVWQDAFGNRFHYNGSNLIVNDNITIIKFKNGDLDITLYKADGTPEPSYPNGSSDDSGDVGGGSSGGGSGSGGDAGNGKDDSDELGNIGEEEDNPDEDRLALIPPFPLGPQKPGGGVGEVPPTAGPANTPPVDPLIFDLDFNGVISLSKPENGRNFDIDNDGIAQKVAWIDSGDAILVCDRNGNGTIDNGLELFGDNTLLEDGTYAKSGIEALAEFDTNKDGKITISDLKFSDLKLLKSDNTIITLEEAGIKEINLSYTAVNKTDKNGNRQVKEAKFITEDGEEHIYGEFMLNQNIYQSVSAEIIPVSEEVAALPDVNGSGLVHSLHQAIMRDVSGDILGALHAFLDEEDIDTKHALCEQLIYKWAGTEDISTTSRGNLFDGRKLATIEAFAGTYLQGSKATPVRTKAAADILNEGFDNFAGFVYSSLAIQTHMSELFSNLNYYLDKDNNWRVDLSSTYPVIEKYMRELEEKAWKELGEGLENAEGESDASSEDIQEQEIEVDYSPVFDKIKDLKFALINFNYIRYTGFNKYVEEVHLRYKHKFDYGFIEHLADCVGTDGNNYMYADDSDHLFYGGKGNDQIIGGLGNDTMYGGEGNDTLSARNGSNALYPGPGNNYVNVGHGYDDVYLGLGNDTIFGGYGSSSYIFDIPNSAEAFSTKFETTCSADRIVFQGVTSEDVVITADNASRVYIAFKDYPDRKITLCGQEPFKRVETYVFDDATFTFAEIREKYLRVHQCGPGNDNLSIPVFADEIHGNKGNDLLHGDERNNILYGDDGNDTLNGHLGDDTLYGGKGDDYLSGSLGNDVLYAGQGNDTLDGYEGDDTYIINPAEISGVSYTKIKEAQGIDTIVFQGVNSDEILAKSDHTGMVHVSFIYYPDSKVEIPGQNDTKTRIETFVFDDVTLSFNEFKKKYLLIEKKSDSSDYFVISCFATEAHGMKGNDTIIGDDRDNIIYGDKGNDQIMGHMGKDTLYGNEGNDCLMGNGDDDIIHGDEGDDTLYGDDGDDTLYGGSGNDSLRGEWGNDVLYAGLGNDTLEGGNGDDTYIINPAEINGASYTKINETQGLETVIFQGINSDEIQAQANSLGQVVITFINYPNNKVELSSQNDTSKRIETFIFDDTTMSFDEIKEKYLS